jgi:predicted nucleotidyltransferase
MRNDELLSTIKDLALKANSCVGNADWYLFGSAYKGLPTASDIDLLVICETHEMADAIRRSVDLDQLTRPIHLSILTKAEELEVRFVQKQDCIQVV